jgi:hypothetical protein
MALDNAGQGRPRPQRRAVSTREGAPNGAIELRDSSKTAREIVPSNTVAYRRPSRLGVLSNEAHRPDTWHDLRARARMYEYKFGGASLDNKWGSGRWK